MYSMRLHVFLKKIQTFHCDAHTFLRDLSALASQLYYLLFLFFLLFCSSLCGVKVEVKLLETIYNKLQKNVL